MERKVNPVLTGNPGQEVEQDRGRAERKNFVDMTQPLECAVCLQTCIHPVQVANQSSFGYITFNFVHSALFTKNERTQQKCHNFVGFSHQNLSMHIHAYSIKRSA